MAACLMPENSYVIFILKGSGNLGKRVLLLADMNSRWTFQYLKKAYANHLEITVIDYASQKLPFGEAYYDFCDKNGIAVISIYNDGGYSRCLKYAAIINQMQEFDLCHIMFVSGWVSLLVSMCEHKFHKIIVNFWGSDFYRTTKKVESEQKYVLDIADIIIVPVEDMKEKFIRKYPKLRDKIYTVYFESPTLKMLEDDTYLGDANMGIQLPDNKAVIAVGYNGYVQQQHEIFIKALNSCCEAIRSEVFVVFLMTYGLSKEYEEYINGLLQDAKFQYAFIRNYMTNEQIVYLRRRIDVFVNAITTDAFNAAIQESMLCQSVILIGNWLSYQDLENEKAYINKFGDETDLAEKLGDVIKNLSAYKRNSEKNRDILKKIRKKRCNVEGWIDVYDSPCQDRHVKGNKDDVWKYVLEQERKQSQRKNLYYEITQNWLKKKLNKIAPVKEYISHEKYTNIVIYGAGTLGELVYDEIKSLNIVINVCDKDVTNVNWIDKEIMKVSDLRKFPCDCVIVTPVHVYDAIAKSLLEIEAGRVISLEEILNE